MGAKFAPSMAHLFMAKWTEDVVLHDRPSQLIMWKRFIDDILCIWDGDAESVATLLSFLNNNNRGIILSYEASLTQIHFLDLVITIEDGKIATSTFLNRPTGTVISHWILVIIVPGCRLYQRVNSYA